MGNECGVGMGMSMGNECSVGMGMNNDTDSTHYSIQCTLVQTLSVNLHFVRVIPSVLLVAERRGTQIQAHTYIMEEAYTTIRGQECSH